MSKKILYNEDARKALKKGVDAVADAEEITLKDKFENMGAEIIKEVATRTNDLAGDGTTTSVVLTQAIIAEGMKHTTMGVNAMGVKFGIEAASKYVVNALRSLAKPIKTDEE